MSISKDKLIKALFNAHVGSCYDSDEAREILAELKFRVGLFEMCVIPEEVSKSNEQNA